MKVARKIIELVRSIIFTSQFNVELRFERENAECKNYRK
jgi:hypothetical protein